MNNLNLTSRLAETVGFNQHNFVDSYDKKVFSINTTIKAKVENQAVKIKVSRTTDTVLQDYAIVTLTMDDRKDQKIRMLVKNKHLASYLEGRDDLSEMTRSDWIEAFKKLQKTSQKEGKKVKEAYTNKKQSSQLALTRKKSEDDMGEITSRLVAVNLKVIKASKAIFLMGATGSGKGTIRQSIVTRHAERNYVIIDPDLIKESMIEYQEAVKKGDTQAATKVHEESVKRATALLKASIEQRVNFIYDSTGSRSWIYEEQMSAAKQKEMFVELIYVATKLEICISRAKERGLKTGRFVPENKIEDSHFYAEENFEELKKLPHRWKKYNNDGTAPQLEASAKVGSSS